MFTFRHKIKKYNKKNTTKRVRRRNHLKHLQKGGDTEIKVMTYNVLARGATDHQFEKHRFELKRGNFHTKQTEDQPKIKKIEHIEQTYRRYELFKTEIEKVKPDIVLLQEVDNYFYQYIKKNLTKYDVYFNLFIPEERGDLSVNFATALMWNTNVFENISSETLDSESATTERFEATTELFEQSDKHLKSLFGNKNATLVKMKHKASNKQLAVVSVHFPGDNKKENKATTEKLNLINYVIKKLKDVEDPNMYKIIGGDFNCPMIQNCGDTVAVPKCCSTIIKKILSDNKYTEAATTGSTYTTCKFDYSQNNVSALIDAIFFNENITFKGTTIQVMDCKKSHPYDDDFSQPYSNVNTASDHAWLMAYLNLK